MTFKDIPQTQEKKRILNAVQNHTTTVGLFLSLAIVSKCVWRILFRHLLITDDLQNDKEFFPLVTVMMIRSIFPSGYFIKAARQQVIALSDCRAILFAPAHPRQTQQGLAPKINPASTRPRW